MDKIICTHFTPCPPAQSAGCDCGALWTIERGWYEPDDTSRVQLAIDKAASNPNVPVYTAENPSPYPVEVSYSPQSLKEQIRTAINLKVESIGAHGPMGFNISASDDQKIAAILSAVEASLPEKKTVPRDYPMRVLGEEVGYNAAITDMLDVVEK